MGQRYVPMPYRSMGINGWRPLDMEMIELAGELGFNDLQITVVGSHFDLYFDFRGRANEVGLFPLTRRMDMTTTLWVREFYNQNQRWGLSTVDNTTYWAGIHRRYVGLAQLYPELDHFILTIVESDKWPTSCEPAVIAKLVNTVNEALQGHGKKLIFRTFAWHPEQAQRIGEAIPHIPEDVIISTKCVGNDWNYRQSHHPLIGKVGEHKQVIEMNLFGTWQREHFVANAYTDEIKRRFDFWAEQGCYGIFVPPDGRTRQSRPIGNAQEMNLWALGRLAGGETDLGKVWLDFCRRRFGPKAASTMVEVLRPTGAVLDESLHVGREFFGHPENGIPALREMAYSKARYETDEEAARVPEDLEKYSFATNPFTINFCTWRWDPSYIPTFHRIRQGAPEIIQDKLDRYHEQLAQARRSLALLETVKDNLPPGGYAFTRWKLENEWHLQVMTEMEMAWLKASNALYFCQTEGEKEAKRQEVEGHLTALGVLNRRSVESIQVTWQGIDYYFRRGEYINIPGFIDEFRRYWDMETGERHVPRWEEMLDTPYGPIKLLRVGETVLFDWYPIARKWDLSDRHIIWTVRRLLTPAEEPLYMSG